MKTIIGNIPNESAFIKKFRVHQGWWRTFVLNEPEGKYWDTKNNAEAKVCNRINHGETSLNNFITKKIGEIAGHAVEINKKNKSGIINEDRLYNNLLSSQPLAFNFIGFLKLYQELALAFVKTIRPEVTSVEDIVFEYAPDSAKDNSAFDFGFIVRSEIGKGFLGFECKYTDTFSYQRTDMKTHTTTFYGDENDKRHKDYHPLYLANRHRLPDDYGTYVKDKRFNQLFRNEILALQLKGYDFITTGLFCHHEDKDALNAGYEFQKKVGNGNNDFIVLTYADYIERLQKLDITWEQRGIVMMLWARYCGLRLSSELTK